MGATKPADEADRIDNIVVKICGAEEQYREIVGPIEADIAAAGNHASRFAIVGPPPQKVSQFRRGNRGRVVRHNR
jgi:hypothetical protein